MASTSLIRRLNSLPFVQNIHEDNLGIIIECKGDVILMDSLMALENVLRTESYGIYSINTTVLRKIVIYVLKGGV